MRIVLYMGLFGLFFCRDFYPLADKLRAQGHTVRVYPWWLRAAGQKWLAEGNGDKGVLGWSLGGNSAVYTTHNVPNVTKCVTFDATARGLSVPKHTTGYNFRTSDWRDRDVYGLTVVHRDDLNHLNVVRDPMVEARVLGFFKKG